MKIKFIIHSFVKYGGGTTSSIEMINAAKKAGYDVDVMFTSSIFRFYFRSLFLGSKNFGFPVSIYKIDRFPFFNSDYDSCSNKGFIVRGLFATSIFYLEIFISELIKCFRNRQNSYNAVMVCHLLPPKSIEKSAKYFRTPIIYNHAGSPELYMKYWLKNLSANNSKNINYCEYMMIYNHILFQSGSHAEAYNKSCNCNKKNFVIPPSFAFSQHFLGDSPFESNAINVVVLGSVIPRKNPCYALAVMYELLNAQKKSSETAKIILHFVGPYERDFQNVLAAKAMSLGISENIVWHGFKFDYLRYLSFADCIAIFSRLEGVPRSFRESLALGKSIVTSDWEGVKDFAVHRRDIQIVEGNDPVLFAMSIYSVLFDLDKRSMYERNSRLLFERFYSVENYEKLFVEMMKDISKYPTLPN